MKNNNRKSLSFILCRMLIVAMALFTVGCGDTDKDKALAKDTETVLSGTEWVGETEFVSGEEGISDRTVLGEGTVVFSFSVVDDEGNETAFEIHTDKEIVGEALEELGLIEGEESAYGLFIKTVNGITVDYDTDGAYWAFYVNGEYATSGVDTTPITEGETYMFKVEKA